MKKLYIPLFLIFIFFWNCKNPKEEKTKKNKHYQFVDSKAVILIDSTFYDWLKKTYGYEQWKPSADDLTLTQSILDSAIVNKEFDFLKKPIDSSIKTYYRQYFPYTNEKGERIIEINAFCEIPKNPPPPEETNRKWIESNWKEKYISVLDGGPCYWKIKINIDKMSYEPVMVNGF